MWRALTDEAVVLLERLQQQHIQIIGRLDDLARAQVHLVAAQGDVEAVSQEIRIGVKNIITHEEQALQSARKARLMPRMLLMASADEAMTWLYPGDPKAYHNKIVRERAPVTGSWFLESEAFLAWCKDKPNGSGARILLGRAIREQDTWLCACIFVYKVHSGCRQDLSCVRAILDAIAVGTHLFA
jgi:hypothetical protein